MGGCGGAGAGRRMCKHPFSFSWLVSLAGGHRRLIQRSRRRGQHAEGRRGEKPEGAEWGGGAVESRPTCSLTSVDGSVAEGGECPPRSPLLIYFLRTMLRFSHRSQITQVPRFIFIAAFSRYGLIFPRDVRGRGKGAGWLLVLKCRHSPSLASIL